MKVGFIIKHQRVKKDPKFGNSPKKMRYGSLRSNPLLVKCKTIFWDWKGVLTEYHPSDSSVTA